MRRIDWVAATRLPAALAVGLAIVLGAGVCAADSAPDHVWLISTRRAASSCPTGTGEDRLAYWRLETDRWLSSDREAFLATDDPAVPTSIFIHGNRTGRQKAVRVGWSVYRHLKREAGDRAFRFVIWSWPADRIRGRKRRDSQVKASRSDVEGYYLASCLQRINPEVPVNLVGHSFGARVITGALHMLAGGRVAGRGLPDERTPAKRTLLRAVLVAAAVDNDWLLPGRRNGLALSQLDSVMITRNSCDPVLRWYPLMYCIRGPRALGHTGPACPAWLGPEGEKIELLGVECSVGRNHDWTGYLSALTRHSRLGRYAFLESAKPGS